MDGFKSGITLIIWLIFGFGFFSGYLFRGCREEVRQPVNNATHAVAQIVRDAAAQPPAFPEVPYDAGAPRVRSRSRSHH